MRWQRASAGPGSGSGGGGGGGGGTGSTLYVPDYTVEAIPIDPNTIYPLTVAQTNTGLVPGHTWHSYQPPFMRGVRQDRMSVLTGADVPGSVSDPYRPHGCLQVTLKAIFNPATDFNVTAVADAGASDTTIYVSPSDAALLVYVGPFGDFMTNQTQYLNSKGVLGSEHIGLVAAPDTIGGALTVRRGVDGDALPITAGDLLKVNTGDINPVAGFRSRCEAYDRYPYGGSNTNPSLWPDPVGSERWYRVAIYLPADMPISTGDWNGTNPWWDAIQWKGLKGGSPPLALGLNVNGDGTAGWRMDHDGAPVNGIKLGSAALGAWTTFDVGLLLGTTKTTAWITVYKNGVLMANQYANANMDLYEKAVDPIYLKNGIYRNNAWTVDHTIAFGPIQVAETQAALY